MDSGISVIIPVYNGELSLPELIERLHAVLESQGVENELILVNDGSVDESWDVICMRLWSLWMTTSNTRLKKFQNF